MLNFLTGRSGSGKTWQITDYIRHDCVNRKHSYLIVPEQQVYISERNILPMLPQDYSLYFHIVSFSRLAGEVFGRFGGLTYQAVSKSTQTLLMWKTLRRLSGLLTEYTTPPDEALSMLMMSAYKELSVSGISPDMLEATAKDTAPGTPLYRKLRDMALVYAEYGRCVSDSYGENPSNIQVKLASILESNNFFSGINVYIDSFTSFTQPEYAVLSQIIRQAEQTYITLCMPVGGHEIQFDSVTDTYRKLRRVADLYDIPTKRQTFDCNRRTDSAELSYIELNLWNFGAPKATDKDIDKNRHGDISVISASDIYSEAEAAALNILRLKSAGIDFGEIAVIVRDTETRRGIIDTALSRYGIPFFMSERTGMCAYPATRLILSALRAVNGGYRRADIMTLIKTGFSGADERDIDLFDEYCTTWNINGSVFCDKCWSMNPDGYKTELTSRGKVILDAANRVRELVMTPLTVLSASMSASDDTGDKCRALFAYLEALGLRTKLSARAGEELQSGLLRDAGETLRLYDLIVQSLVTLCGIFNGDKLNNREFACALSMIFSETDIGSVPSVHDCVIIGSAATVRVENIRAVLVLGLIEGEFPGNTSEHSIFSDTDKRILSEAGIEIGQPVEYRSSDELFYIYRAFSKPSDKLMLFLPRTRLDGRENTRSPALTRIEYLLPYLREQKFDADAIHAITSATEATADCFGIPETQKISPEAAHRLFGDTLRLTQAKLTSYTGCPYKFYCEYILSLREEKEAAVSYADSGDFIHYVLEHFFRATLGTDGKIRQLNDEETDKLTSDILDEYIRKMFGTDGLDNNPRILHVFIRLRQLTLILIRDILNEFANSAFTPVAFEKVISENTADAVPPLRIPVLDNSDLPNVILTGKIDRIDIWRDGDTIYLRVVDYKSGKKTFSLSDFTEGLDIQLLLYLFTVSSPEYAKKLYGDEKAIKPAGAMYLYADNNDGKYNVSRSGIVLDDENVMHAMTADMDSGILGGHGSRSKGNTMSEEQIKQLELDMRGVIKEIAGSIYSGCAPRTPSCDACRYCRIKSTCPVAVTDKNF